MSALVVYDSFIHSGSIPMFLRKRFIATFICVPLGGALSRVKRFQSAQNVAQTRLTFALDRRAKQDLFFLFTVKRRTNEGIKIDGKERKIESE